MKMQTIRKTLLVGTVLFVAGVSLAFAQGGGRGNWGGGYNGDCPGYGTGPGMMDGRGMGRGMMNDPNLSQEQRDQLSAERDKFLADTEELRDSIRDKRNALREEMSKQDPDTAKVGQIQKELSALQGDFDQKRVQHQLEVRKILPDDYRGAGGPRNGRGAHRGRQ
jgi:Spy/CpxP family protein refolding chaperone